MTGGDDRGIAAEALRRIADQLGGPPPPVSPADLAEFEARCGGDVGRCQRWIRRRLAGEPLAHITGVLRFRGREFAVDKRVYVTDPELTHLIDAVLARAAALAAGLGREPLLAEIGVGCGALSLSVLAERPGCRVVGLDVDADALAVARRNADALGLPLRLLESDLFEAWPQELPPPDLVFGDPPWGDESTLYGDDRPARHYLAMPPSSAFALGGRTGLHRQILRAMAARGWTGEAWLNGGTLPGPELLAAAPPRMAAGVVSPAPNVRLLHAASRGAA